MKFSGETLMAYADGELDARICREIEAALPGDPAAAGRIARHRALQASLRTTFAPVLHDAVPQRLIDAAHQAGGKVAEQVPDRRLMRHLAALRSGHWAAIVGSVALLVGVLVGRTVNIPPPSAVTTLDGRMLAGGTLATALFEQAGGSEPLQSEVVVGLSYLAKTGVYCRTFTVKQNESIAGIACREADGWHIQALAQTGPKSPLTQYRMAGTSVPPLLMGMVESTIDGSPLDTEAEAAAHQRQWQRM